MNRSKINLTKEHDIFLLPQRNLGYLQKDTYLDNIENQFNMLKPYLPRICNNLLSIGCGLAIPELPFYELYQNEDLNFFLFDKTQVDDNIHFGHEKTASFYNDLKEAKKLYINYGIKEQNIHLIDASNKNLCSLPKMDIITSFISWGFHFPLETYLENVIKLMHNDSILIIDIRILNGNSNINLINKYFKIMNENKEFKSKKSIRYILKLK